MKYLLVFAFASSLSISIHASNKFDFNHAETFAFKQNSGTHALVIYQNDQIQLEKYSAEFGPNKKHIAWSISKSVSSTLIGALVAEDKIKIKNSVCSYLKNSSAIPHCRLTPHDFLSWSSGFNWNESYENEAGDPTESSVAQLLYGDGYKSSLDFIFSHSQNKSSDIKQRWNYSTGDSTVVMALAQSVMSDVDKENSAKLLLFDKLGVTDFFFQKDKEGTILGGSGLFIKPRDLLRFGLLYLNKGTFEGNKIFAPSWYDYTITSDFNDQEIGQTSYYPMRSWWGLSKGLRAALNLKQEVLIARGHWGQFLIIIPELRLVIVRMGFNQSTRFDAIQLVESVLLDLGHIKNRNKELKKFKNEFKPNKKNQKKYTSPITTLGLRYRANHACQCLYTMGINQTKCLQISSIMPEVFKLRIDNHTKSVESYLSQSNSTAVTYQYNSQLLGCE